VDIAKLRGKLPWPVTGKLRKRYAPGATPTVRGLGFSADDRSAVRAVAAGTVVHNDILRGFGTVVIIQHDKDYFSLYAFLGSSPMRVGDQVRGGQQLGTVGFYPAIEGPGLYFELRYKQKPINPEQWFTS
jgi:septal ring factor EnvC (AmiA/AmiB activator)